MRVLFIRYSALGDIVLATGVIEQFQKKFPEAEIHVLTDSLGSEVFSCLGFVKRVFDVRSMGLLKTIKSLPDYDYVFDLQSKIKSKIISHIKGSESFTIDKGAKERRDFVKTKKQTSGLHITQRYFKTCLEPFNVKEPSLNDLRSKLSLGGYQSKINLPDNFIAIHPYASQANKVWPYFSELIDELVSKSVNVVIVGHGEKLNFNKKALDLTSKTSIKDLMFVIASAKQLITTDSGPLHIATGLKTPTLSLFGPTSKEFGFYPAYEDSIVIENNNLSCRPCHVHGGNACPVKHFRCMREISIKDVIKKVLL